MDIEQLKLILETINKTTNTASNAAIWWMAMHYGLELLKTAAWSGTVVLSVKFVAQAIAIQSESAAFMMEMREAIGMKGGSWLTAYDLEKTTTAIREAVQKSKGAK